MIFQIQKVHDLLNRIIPQIQGKLKMQELYLDVNVFIFKLLSELDASLQVLEIHFYNEKTYRISFNYKGIFYEVCLELTSYEFWKEGTWEYRGVSEEEENILKSDIAGKWFEHFEV